MLNVQQIFDRTEKKMRKRIKKGAEREIEIVIEGGRDNEKLKKD
jgi:hypothetical protein